MKIPETMKALIIDAYNSNLIRAMQAMKLMEIPMPQPDENHVLIKIELTPVNPSDIAFLRGGYNISRPLPAIPGFEGTGKIVETGSGVDKSFVGRRVSFFSQSEYGTWAEYTVIRLSDCIFLNNDLSVEQASCLFVNPFTARGMFDHILTNGHQALIQSAAMGQIGQFIRYFARESNLPVINLVRKDVHVEMLQAEGEQFVLNMTNEKFQDDLARMATALNASAALDAVGGELTGKILNAMPKGSELILYGGLSGIPVGQMDPLEIIFKNKVLWGFNLGDWLNDLSDIRLSKISDEIQTLFIQKKLETKIQQIFPLENFYGGLRKYISNMSGGKVLFQCE
ncbi:MAG: alcohol dehydrogenase catalytic domain-containing protein [Bacteroidales bacterium]|nr:alcohol dehydrogenase catalytic domain-containing protein [Bacteroidales bacterium]